MARKKSDPSVEMLMNEFVERAGGIMRELFAPKFQEVNCRFDEIGGRFDFIEQKLRSFEQISEGIEKRISAVNKRSAEIEQKLDATGQKVDATVQRVARVERRQRSQQEQLDELKDCVGRLIREDSGAVIRRDGKRVAVDRETAYREINAVCKKKNHRAAMRMLYDAGIICRDSEGKFTTPVWKPGEGVVRAVIILDGGGENDAG